MRNFIDVFVRLRAMLPKLSEMAQRRYGLQVGRVVTIDDPMGLRRVRVTDGRAESGWLVRVCPFPGIDATLPKVGDLIFYGYVDGDVSEGSGYWMGVPINAQNPEALQSAPAVDATWNVFGRRSDSAKDYELHVAGQIVLRNNAGASIRLLGNGEIVLEDGFGTKRSLRQLANVPIPPLETAMAQD